MKRMIDIALLCLVPALCFGAASVRDVDLTFDTANDADLLVSHKASSGLKIDGTVTNSQDSALVDISGSTVTCGFKTDVTATNFLVFATGSLVDSGTGGQFTVTLPAAQWVTNISRKIRYYGDVRISGLGNPLPSIELWLYPSANTGAETTYVAPSDASWQTNGVDVGDVTTVNFASGITAANTNGTLTVSASGNGQANATIAGDGIDVTTNGTDYTVAVDSTVFRADGSVALTGDLNAGGQAVTNKVSDQFTSTTNSLTTQFYSASNRWAHVEVYGSTTNIIFITPER